MTVMKKNLFMLYQISTTVLRIFYVKLRIAMM